MSAPSSLAALAQLPRVAAVTAGSPAALAGVAVGDEIVSLCGEAVRDIIQYRMLADEADPWLEVRRGGLELDVEVAKRAGEPLGIELDAAVFDRVRTCDNHCEFCFIYQLPPGMRRSLSLKDDDYRLSFLFGNFTTLTRFTEADLERVITEGLSPLYVSIHATDPLVRADMLRNRRGATSLRWLRQLLDHGVTVHGQLVICPGVNDGTILEDTLCGIADSYPELATVAVVPLGLSRYNTAERMRLHTTAEAASVLDIVEAWQARFLDILHRRVVFAADEYYLMAGRAFPPADAYEGFPLHEDGVGMARAFAAALRGEIDESHSPQPGFFAWSDAATATAGASKVTATVAGYRAPRCAPGVQGEAQQPAQPVQLRASRRAPVAILTGEFGAAVLEPLLADLRAYAGGAVRLLPVQNRFFGGNVGVSGLLVGEDLSRVLAGEPAGHRYLLPDVCVSEGRFLDGGTPAELPHPVEIVATDGASLRHALERR